MKLFERWAELPCGGLSLRCGVGKENFDEIEKKERKRLKAVLKICIEQLTAVFMPSDPERLLVRMMEAEVGNGSFVRYLVKGLRASYSESVEKSLLRAHSCS